ncbi:ATP-binding protein [Streptomyces sp. SL13]|uniref:ATP-binding protein n=1 Tax=Streptantibioticus silvisoli TaxID=2705255 RepID=A0AA90KC29_9ACTN|nr:ATP-binding protein [Streptantibioticus silvisoli]MDI5974037.1 ATP-binding protein [Streptantibioticus silvisoli]
MTESIRPEREVLLYAWADGALRPAAEARALLCRRLVEWGCAGDGISDLVLAVSELVANATEHATGPYEVWLRREISMVVCEVHDQDPHVPVLPVHPAGSLFAPDSRHRGGGLEGLLAVASERGRGLQIVDHLSEGCWGFRLSGDGKKVAWVKVRLENSQSTSYER